MKMEDLNKTILSKPEDTKDETRGAQRETWERINRIRTKAAKVERL